jgi:hypothetical protein
MLAPSLAVCGAQTGWPTRQELLSLKAFLLSEPRLRQFLTAIRELPGLWPTLTEAVPELRSTPGSDLLRQIPQWIDDEDSFERDSTPPAISS